MGLLKDLAQRVESGLGSLRRIAELPARMDVVEERMDIVSADQDYLDQVADHLGQYQVAIQAEIDDLEAKVAAGQTITPMDFTRINQVSAGYAAMVPTVSDPTTPLPELPPVVTDPAPSDPAPSDPEGGGAGPLPEPGEDPGYPLG